MARAHRYAPRHEAARDGDGPRRDLARAGARPGAHARLSRLPARKHGQGGGGPDAVRRGVREDGLEPLFEAAGVRSRQPRQRLRHLLAYGARAAEAIVGRVQVLDHAFLLVGEEAEVELRIAHRDLRLELLQTRDLPVAP